MDTFLSVSNCIFCKDEITPRPMRLSSQTKHLSIFPFSISSNILEKIGQENPNLIYKNIEEVYAIKNHEELIEKLEEFATYNDSLEEVFENREQIEISKHYEKLPKPTLISIQEFMDDKVYFRNPAKEPK